MKKLNEEKFDISDEEKVKQGLDLLKDNETSEEDVEIVDVQAESEKELEDSYVGKYIFQCDSCKQLFYPTLDKLTIDEDGELTADIQCPNCNNDELFTLIGKVSNVDEEELETKIDDFEKELADEDEMPADDAQEEPVTDDEEIDTEADVEADVLPEVDEEEPVEEDLDQNDEEPELELDKEEEDAEADGDDGDSDEIYFLDAVAEAVFADDQESLEKYHQLKEQDGFLEFKELLFKEFKELLIDKINHFLEDTEVPSEEPSEVEMSLEFEDEDVKDLDEGYSRRKRMFMTRKSNLANQERALHESTKLDHRKPLPKTFADFYKSENF